MARHCANWDCPGLARDGVVPEFVDSVSHCLDCGSPLSLGPRVAPPDPALEYHPLVTVLRAQNPVHGHLIAAAIENAGIPVYLKGESLQGAIGELPATVAQVEVQVPVERGEEALEIVARWESEEAGPEDVVARALARLDESEDGEGMD